VSNAGHSSVAVRRSPAAIADVTFIILTYNEEKRLSDCLNSLDGVARNVFVVDSYSTDGTVALLDTRSVRYLQHEFKDYGAQRRWAQQNDPYASPWVFHIDADERLSDSLRRWLLEEFPRAAETADGFLFSRRTVFMGRWIRWGGHYPTYHLRLYRAAMGRCEDKAYDQHFLVDGSVEVVRGADIIDTVMSDLGSFVRSHERWSTNEAQEQLASLTAGEIRPVFGNNPIQRRRWVKRNLYDRSPLLLRPFLYFLYRYILRLGFLDGKEGAIFHVLQGFWFRFLVDAKILEHRSKTRS
jgi:glycosyltransferase involved in cell wall biosynthesis